MDYMKAVERVKCNLDSTNKQLDTAENELLNERITNPANMRRMYDSLKDEVDFNIILLEALEYSKCVWDAKLWKTYTKYLQTWAFQHTNAKYLGMSPLRYNEWLDKGALEERQP